MKLGLQVLGAFQRNRTPAASTCFSISGQVWTRNSESGQGGKGQILRHKTSFSAIWASQVPKDAKAVAVAGIKGKSFEAGVCHSEAGGSFSIAASKKSDLLTCQINYGNLCATACVYALVTTACVGKTVDPCGASKVWTNVWSLHVACSLNSSEYWMVIEHWMQWYMPDICLLVTV